VGVSSAEVNLCGGTEDTPIHTLLSAAPQIVKIAPGERDEMSILVEDGVYVEIAFRHGDYAYFDRTDRLITTGMAVGVVDVDAVCATFTRRTGAPATEMGEFEVRLRSDKMDSKIIRITRNYVIDRENKGAGFGRRLAWINRFGAVDYCTFPTVSRYRAGGGRTTVVTNNGLRTVGTSAGQSIDLMSEPCSPLVAEWLAGIFSSPAVWTVDKGDWERVEVKAGEVVCEASKPAVVCVTIAPSVQNVSRCF
jgi:hypothetical protein